MEMRCFRRIRNIFCKYHITNEKVQKLCKELGHLKTCPHGSESVWAYLKINGTFKEGKMKLQRTVQAGRRRDRKKKKNWEDNFQHWTGF